MPVMQLKRVVFPAPLGPINANTWPFGTSKLTWSTAVKPPNRLITPCSERIVPWSVLTW